MTRRFYRLEVDRSEKIPGEITSSFVLSADLDGEPDEVMIHGGLYKDVEQLGFKVGYGDDLGAVLAEHLKPDKVVVSVDEFIFGVVCISRFEIFRQFLQMGLIDESYMNASCHGIHKDDEVSIDEALRPDILVILHKYLNRYAESLVRNIHQNGLRVQTCIDDEILDVHGPPVNNVQPNPFFPGFIQQLHGYDLSQEQRFLASIDEKCSSIALTEAFEPLVEGRQLFGE